MTRKEYNEQMKARRDAVSKNRANRILGRPPVPVPAKPEKPKVPVAYAKDGTYEGRIQNDEQMEMATEQGFIIKYEDAF